MKGIDLSELLTKALSRYSGGPSVAPFPVFLALPATLPTLASDLRPMEDLVHALLETAVFPTHFERPVRVAAIQRKQLEDVEALLRYRPSCWVELQFEIPSADGPPNTIRDLPEKYGFSCQEDWVMEDGNSRLTSYTLGNAASPALVLWLAGRRASQRISILIPLPAQEH